MIDLHCHLLPGLDDGAADLSVAIEMARIAYADGIRTIACTPHAYPDVFDNGTSDMVRGLQHLRQVLAREKIQLQLHGGADIHIAPDLGRKLKAGQVPTLGGSRYFLFEPPHHVLPPRLLDFTHGLISEGYVPILTHPERLSWVHGHYDVFKRLNDAGCLVQLTAGSLLGSFGRGARYLAERMLDEGRVDILATDAHDSRRRPPLLAGARDCVAARLGEAEANAMVDGRPGAILANRILRPQGGRNARLGPEDSGQPEGFFKRLFGA